MTTSAYQDKPPVLVVDDDKSVLLSLEEYLRASFRPLCVASAQEAINIMKSKTFPVVLADIALAGIDGVSMLQEIKKAWPLTEVVMITGDSSLDQATLCIEKGAFDYVLKPFNLKYLGKIVGHAAEKSDLSRKLAITQARVEKSISTVDKISPSSLPKMRQLKTVLEEAAELAFASLQDKDFSRNHFLVRAALRELERNLIIKTLAKLDWNQSETADFLGTSRSTLVRKMRLFKIPTAKQPTNFK